MSAVWYWNPVSRAWALWMLACCACCAPASAWAQDVEPGAEDAPDEIEASDEAEASEETPPADAAPDSDSAPAPAPAPAPDSDSASDSASDSDSDSDSDSASDSDSDSASDSDSDSDSDDAATDLDEWGLPPVEDAPPAPPPPPYEIRLAWEIFASFLGAAAVGAIGFGIGVASVGADQTDMVARPLDDVLLGGLIGAGIAWPIGAAFGTWLAGENNGGTGDAAGPVLGSLFGAGLGVAGGAILGYATEDLTVGVTFGAILGGIATLAGAVIGYELSSGPHPRADDEAEGDDDTGSEQAAASPRLAPLIAPSDSGGLVGLSGVF